MSKETSSEAKGARPDVAKPASPSSLRDVSFSAARAASLRLVNDEANRVRREEHETAAKRKGPGGWRWQWFGGGREAQIRNTAIPTLRLDMTRTEVRDLLLTLALALDEPTIAIVRPSMWERFLDWLARRTWRKAHETELLAARKQLAREFRETGGW